MKESKELVVQEPVEVAPPRNPFADLSLTFKHLGTFSDKSRIVARSLQGGGGRYAAGAGPRPAGTRP